MADHSTAGREDGPGDDSVRLDRRPSPVTRGLLIGGGVAGPAAFFVISVIAGVTEPGYSQVEDHLSGLASIPAANRWLMTTGFVLVGVGVALVAAAVGRIQGRNPATPLLVVAGLATGLVGVLPRSCIEVVCADPAWHHRLHDGFSVPGYAALLVMPIVIAARTDLGASRRFAGGVVVVTAALSVLFAADLFTGVGGLIQRALVFGPLAWLAAVTARAGRSSHLTSGNIRRVGADGLEPPTSSL